MRQTGAVPPRLARLLALGGLIFFVDSLLYFVYRYVVAFGRETAGPVSYGAIAADVVLFSVFALHHSLFARDVFRKLITRLVGALERSVYVWIASALFIAVCALWRPVAGVAWQVNQPVLAWCIVAAQMVGIWLALRSAFLIDIRELSGLRQLDTDARRVQKDPRDASGAEGQVLSDPPSASGTVGQVLSDQPSASDAVGRVLSDPPVPPIEFKTRGPYGWVRHPIYSGWFLIVFAVPVMTLTRLVFAVTSSVYLLIAIPFEERSLRRSSQGAYDQYTRKVRWRLVPRLF